MGFNRYKSAIYHFTGLTPDRICFQKFRCNITATKIEAIARSFKNLIYAMLDKRLN